MIFYVVFKYDEIIIVVSLKLAALIKCHLILTSSEHSKDNRKSINYNYF